MGLRDYVKRHRTQDDPAEARAARAKALAAARANARGKKDW